MKRVLFFLYGIFILAGCEPRKDPNLVPSKSSGSDTAKEKNRLVVEGDFPRSINQDSLHYSLIVTMSRQQPVDLKLKNNKFSDDPNLNLVLDRITTYFKTLESICNESTPVWPNASNGWFRERILEAKYSNLGQQLNAQLTGSAKDLFDVYLHFYRGNQAAFMNNGNYPAGPADVVRIRANQIVPALWAPFRDIISSKDSYVEANKNLIYLYFVSVIDEIANNPEASGGAHANGHISSAVKGAALSSLKELNDRFKPEDKSEAGKAATILRILFTSLSQLQTEGHNPWLVGSWQGSYQVLMGASKMSLQALSYE